MASYKLSQVLSQLFHGIAVWIAAIIALMGSLALVASAATGTAFADEGRHHALVIGVERFERARDLRNPSNDARAVAGRLAELGYAIFAGGPHLNPGRSDMLALMRDFAAGIPDGATAVVYIAGHGLSDGGDTYLIPADDGDLRARADLSDQAVALRALTGRLAARHGVNALVLVDACRANGLRGQGPGAGGSGDLVAGPGGSMSLIYAAAPGQIAADGEGDISPFAASLLLALADPEVTVETLFRRLARTLRAATEGGQTPWMMRSYGDVAPVYLVDP